VTLALEPDSTPVPHKPITVRPAPRREPPYDDEAPHLRLVGPHEQALPFDEPWPGRLRDVLPWQSPQLSARGDLPDPAAWARRLIIGVIEARAGRRPLQQVSSLLSSGVYTGLARDLAGASPARRSDAAQEYRIRSVHASEPADGVAEIAAVVQMGPRFRAIAARLEGIDGNWRCVRLQIG
jgi:hypothetical protein